METQYLFVYGTLKRNSEHPMHYKMTRHASYYCDAWIQGELIDLGGYPGLIQNKENNHNTRGEVYQITDPKALFELLDEYEECSKTYPEPHEYLRKKREVFPENTPPLIAWVYLYNNHFKYKNFSDSKK